MNLGKLGQALTAREIFDLIQDDLEHVEKRITLASVASVDAELWTSSASPAPPLISIEFSPSAMTWTPSSGPPVAPVTLPPTTVARASVMSMGPSRSRTKKGPRC